MSMEPPADFLERLNECLTKFKADVVDDVTERYTYYPDYAASRLGSGSYGEAFRMKSTTNPNEALRVVKVIPKARVSRNALQIQHLAAELAVTGLFSHAHLNKRVALMHSTTHIYLVLELVEGTKPDVKTRLAHLFALYHPRRLADVNDLIAAFEKDATAGGYSSVEEYLEASGRMRTLLAECGAKREPPTGGDLFGLIVALKRVPDGLSKIIMKQGMQALAHLHENNVVHRDVKTENLVLALSRNAELITEKDENGVEKIVGTRITETVVTKLIDFGLVKYMKLGQFPSVISPGMFQPGAKSGAASASAAAASKPQQPSQSVVGLGANAANLGFDDSDDDAAVKPSGTAQPAPGVPAVPSPAVFPVAVTPCGTELYCSLEVIDGILQSGVGRSKWMSDSTSLPKMDVYGVGTMLFCCANGRPPFRPARDQYRQVSREDRIRQVQRLVAAGPVFSSGVAQDTQDFIKFLMNNDENQRPTAAEALRHPYLANVRGDSYSYEVRCDGAVKVVETTAEEDADDGDDDAARDLQNDVMAVLRGREDQGDSAGK